MEVILERENLKELVNGSLPFPKMENGLREWKSKDLDAKMEMMMRLGPQIDKNVHSTQ